MSSRSKEMTTAEAFITFHKDLMLDARTVLPGRVAGTNIVNGKLVSIDVQLGIQQLKTSKDKVTPEPMESPIVPGVPYVIPRSQTTGFSLTVPIAINDDVLLVFSDRSIDNWQSTGKVAPPAEPVIPRIHDITDAIAIVGITNDKTGISNYDQDRITMRNANKSVFVSVSNSSVEIENNGLKVLLENNQITIENNGINIELTGSDITLQNGASSITIESGKITIDSPIVEISGATFDMASSTNAISGGGLTGTTGIDYDDHVHSNPEGGNTGPPANP